MKLHNNKPLYRDAIQFTAQYMQLQPEYIEKDYWVCYALQLIYSSEFKDDVIFKGGTALSKCYQIIERFSEDIDLVLLREGNESGNQLKRKLKNVTKILKEPFREQEEKGITNKMGMIRKIAYNYPKAFKGEFGQIRDIIILEASWLGNFEPYSTKQVSSYIYEMMIAKGQQELVSAYDMSPFKVIVLDVRLTLCEKIMSITRFSHTKNPIIDLRNKIRHFYDIHKLLILDDVSQFFESEDFEKMLLSVAEDDVLSFKNENEWLEKHPMNAIIFKASEEVWGKLSTTYTNDFRNLVYGELPDENDILKSLKKVSNRLKSVKWNIKV
jgi:hypothetical protein